MVVKQKGQEGGGSLGVITAGSWRRWYYAEWIRDEKLASATAACA